MSKHRKKSKHNLTLYQLHCVYIDTFYRYDKEDILNGSIPFYEKDPTRSDRPDNIKICPICYGHREEKIPAGPGYIVRTCTHCNGNGYVADV